MSIAIQKSPSDTHLKTAIWFNNEPIEFQLHYTEKEHHAWLIGLNNIYEPEVIGAILNYAQLGDVCIDAGANLGYHTLLLSKLVGRTGAVIAIDADATCVKKCQDNMKLNDAVNVRVIEKALWEDQSCSYFYQTDICGYSSFLKYADIKSEKTIRNTDTLDNLINPHCDVRVLKIDCEGAEDGILRGARKLLERGVDAVITEFNWAILKYIDSSDGDIRNFMCALGYQCYLLTPTTAPQLVPHHCVIEAIGAKHFNVLFTRKALPDWQSWWKIV